MTPPLLGVRNTGSWKEFWIFANYVILETRIMAIWFIWKANKDKWCHSCPVKKTECPWKAKEDKNFYPQGNARGDDHAELFHNQQQVRNGEVQVLEIKTWILLLEKEKTLFSGFGQSSRSSPIWQQWTCKYFPKPSLSLSLSVKIKCRGVTAISRCDTFHVA